MKKSKLSKKKYNLIYKEFDDLIMYIRINNKNDNLQEKLNLDEILYKEQINLEQRLNKYFYIKKWNNLKYTGKI